MDRKDPVGEPVGTVRASMNYPPVIALSAAAVAAAGFLMLADPGPDAFSGGTGESGQASGHARARAEGVVNATLEPVRTDIRDITPASVHRPPTPEGTMVARLPAVTRPEPKRPARQRSWVRPQVLGAGILQSGGVRIVIEGVAALSPETICPDAGGREWPCGRFARTAMRRLIRQRTIECDPASENAHAIMTGCVVSGHDIGAWLVSQGWAIAKDAEYKALEIQARDAGRGQWARRGPTAD